jgi:glucans biosynthesis protein
VDAALIRFRSAPCGAPALIALAVATLCLLPWRAAAAFNFDDVAQRARQLASTSFKAQDAKLPAEVEQLGYDQFRDIRFKPARMHWRGSGLPFELAFFHRGLFFKQPASMR